VRYDGLYQSPKEYSTYWRYLRFYEDGTVLKVSAMGTPSTRWFNKQHKLVSKGTYSIHGDRIKFSATSPYGTVDYEGTILETGEIKLNTHSRINGHRDTLTFRFREWERAGGQQGGSGDANDRGSAPEPTGEPKDDDPFAS
jgi:hypothetical protein